MRFHVVAPPHTQVTAAYTWHPQTTNAAKFCWMLKSLGHYVALYSAGEDTDAPSDLHVGCAANLGRTVQAIRRTLEPQDFVCLFYGAEQAAIARAFPNHTVCEPAVGYSASCARYRVFPSYAWLHTMYGAERGTSAQPHFYDAVIPHQVVPWDHTYHPGPGDYYVYLGSGQADKGLHLAEQVCEHLGAPLLVAGDAQPRAYGTAVGRVGPEGRSQLLGAARALFAPTLYIEPFGLAAVEAMASGTPAITTDWGAYLETVEHGRTGYRCRTLAEFIEAAEQAPSLDRAAIRERALARWSLEHVRHEYEAYFTRLMTLWGSGWATLPEEARSG